MIPPRAGGRLDGDGREYRVFATAPSMNGYTSTTASITLDSGLKTTRLDHAAEGVFLDIEVSAGAPQYRIAAGFGDSLCRSTAQIDWYFSHMLLGTEYATSASVLQAVPSADSGVHAPAEIAMPLRQPEL